MDIRLGYEYRYRVSPSDDFKEEEGVPVARYRTYVLQVRTNFILKPIRISPPGAEEILVGRERFGTRLAVGHDDLPMYFAGTKLFELISGKNKVDEHLRARLSQYSMPDAQIRALAQTVFDFVVDPSHDSLHTIPVLAAVDVCTVQLEGEPLDATVDRSVIPEFLIPLRLRWKRTLPRYGIFCDLRNYLLQLPVVRVRGEDEDVDVEMESCPMCIPECVGFDLGYFKWDKYAYHEKHSVGRKEGMDLMDECSICLRDPIVGAKIASLPCKHAFHDHCIFKWLLNFKQCCPVCYVEIEFMTDYTKTYCLSSNDTNTKEEV